MHDGMEKGAPAISRKQHILLCALAGLLILGGVLIFSAHSDLQNAEKQFEDTISYVKEQCTGYDNLEPCLRDQKFDADDGKRAASVQRDRARPAG